MTIIRSVAALAVAAMMCACAGRAPQPVPVVQGGDRSLDCGQIEAEAQANNAKLKELGREESGKVAQNVVAGVAGLFFFPLWFAMDFQGAATKETTRSSSASST